MDLNFFAKNLDMICMITKLNDSNYLGKLKQNKTKN